MIIAMAIMAYTVLAWIFSLTVQPGWNSSIFAPYFIIAGLYSGVSFIIITMYIIREIFSFATLYKEGPFHCCWCRVADYFLTLWILHI